MFQQYVEERYTGKVAKGYIRDYLDFEAFIKEKEVEPTKATETDVKEYIGWLREKGYSNTTVAKKLSLLRTYFKWLRKNGEMIHNPMDDIQLPRIVDDKRIVTDEERALLMELVNETNVIRDKAIFHMLVNEGIKPNEMIHITFKDIDLEQRMLYLDKKVIAIGEQTAYHLSQMKEEVGEGFLLTNQHGHPLKESGIYFVIKNYLKLLDNPKIKPMDLIRRASS